ncbi:hypothetical protein BS78_10G111900 [Paspalum vaginatum]|nr:hypothetical protein BS78_10G111900 [Paspalum vaginatum]
MAAGCRSPSRLRHGRRSSETSRPRHPQRRRPTAWRSQVEAPPLGGLFLGLQLWIIVCTNKLDVFFLGPTVMAASFIAVELWRYSVHRHYSVTAAAPVSMI